MRKRPVYSSKVGAKGAAGYTHSPMTSKPPTSRACGPVAESEGMVIIPMSAPGGSLHESEERVS